MLEVKQLCHGTDRIDGQTNGRIALFQNAPPPRAGHNKATWRGLTLLRFWLPLVHVLCLPSEGRHTRLALEVSVPKVSFCRPAVAHLKNRPTYAAKVRSRRIGCRYVHSCIVHSRKFSVPAGYTMFPHETVCRRVTNIYVNVCSINMQRVGGGWSNFSFS